MIQDVAGRHPVLKAIPTNREAAEDAHIEVVVRRAAEEIAPRVAPLVTRLRERRRMVVDRVRARMYALSNWCTLLERLLSATLVHRRVVAGDCKRCTGIELVDTVALPV